MEIENRTNVMPVLDVWDIEDMYDCEYPPCPSCGRIGCVVEEDDAVICKCGEVLRYADD